jgi:ElaB/YqjD/DUF883 family membrane-anchored ribosome-binding protein
VRSVERTENAQRLDILLKDINDMKEEEKKITELLDMLESGLKNGRISREERGVIKEAYDEQLKDTRTALSGLKQCMES